VPHSFAFCANEWAFNPTETLDSTRLDLERPFLKLHSDRWSLATQVSPISAPGPLLRALDQSALNRISMHVLYLLNLFPRALHAEIVETLLPDRELCRSLRNASYFGVDRSRESLFDDFHHHRRIAHLGLCDEQVKRFGHDDVSIDNKAILATRLFEDGCPTSIKIEFKKNEVTARKNRQ
jgi:hypothetical protein